MRNRSNLLTALALLPILAATVPTMAMDIDLGGQVRVRDTTDARDFDRDLDAVSFAEVRTRLNLSADPQENLHVFLQLQDSRIMGENSGNLGDDDGVGLHQGFLRYEFTDDWFYQAGRFEVALANQRLLGSVGWANTGRSWDGSMLSMDNEKHRFDFFSTKLVENKANADSRDLDRDLIGAHFTCKEKGVQAFLYYDLDRQLPDSTVVDRDFDRFTAGVFSKRTFAGNFDYEAMGAYQFGSVSTTSLDSVAAEVLTETDIAAYMAFVEVGYTFGDEKKTRVAVLADYSSGDEDGADDKIESFNNLYYTGHKFRGYMDLFLASNSAGLLDLALRCSTPVTSKVKAKLDVHRFSAAQNYLTDPGDATALGTEIDLALHYNDGKFGFQLGGGSFLKHGDAKGYAGNLVGLDNGFWAYTMATASF